MLVYKWQPCSAHLTCFRTSFSLQTDQLINICSMNTDRVSLAGSGAAIIKERSVGQIYPASIGSRKMLCFLFAELCVANGCFASCHSNYYPSLKMHDFQLLCMLWPV